MLVIPVDVGGTCVYRACCWRELFKGRLLFFQLVLVVLVPLEATDVAWDDWLGGV